MWWWVKEFIELEGIRVVLGAAEAELEEEVEKRWGGVGWGGWGGVRGENGDQVGKLMRMGQSSN